jgi:transposase
MRYELTDYEWDAIKPMLPNKPRGVPRVNDRRVLNGIFWILRSSVPWRDLPENFGPYTTCYNRFVRWRRAGVWDVSRWPLAKRMTTVLSSPCCPAWNQEPFGSLIVDLTPIGSELARNLVERFFNKIKQCRRVATRYDKLAGNYLAFIQLASIRLWLRVTIVEIELGKMRQQIIAARIGE